MIKCSECGSSKTFIVRSSFGGVLMPEKVVCKDCHNNQAVMPKDRKPPPSHYAQGDLQPWDVIKDWSLNFWQGNVIKYMCRVGKKESEHPRQEYEKMIDYIEECIRQLDE
jgi:hypothetical protein